MTAKDLITIAGEHWAILLAWFVGVPISAWLLGLVHGKGNGARSPWRYLYSVLIYAACFPGMLAAVLTAYSLFFIQQNLLDANLLVYFLPIVSMVVVVAVVRARVDFDDVPGFDRIAGLMTLIAIMFIIVLAIERTRIWLFFGGSITRLIGLVVGLFALLKWSAYMVFRRPDEPKADRPALPT